jgi:hypothetical protein
VLTRLPTTFPTPSSLSGLVKQILRESILFTDPDKLDGVHLSMLENLALQLVHRSAQGGWGRFRPVFLLRSAKAISDGDDDLTIVLANNKPLSYVSTLHDMVAGPFSLHKQY